MDLFSIILYLGLYYLRPQEWIEFVKMLRLVDVTVLLAIVSLFNRYRGLRWNDVIKTPLDWIMLAYIVWILYSTDRFQFTFKVFGNLYIFYVLTVLTLHNVERIELFLKWWTGWILALALLAVASEFGYDPTGSYDLTHEVMKGRLTLNISVFRNPNALGHTIVPGIVMLYFTGFWRRPAFVKIATVFIVLLPLYCVWLTVSKGAFLCGFATVVLALSFKRSKMVQVGIFVVAATLGWAALTALPRMQEMSESKSDQAIQGRVAAFRFGLQTMNQHWKGIGVKNFGTAFYREFHFPKASHSSYVNQGAELGKPGLYLFLGVMYCCLRTLFQAKTRTDNEERIRRILFVLLISYMASSWMVDWSDRGTFFLMSAAIGAFHRHLLKDSQLHAGPLAATGSQPLPARNLKPLQPAPLAAHASLVTNRPAVPVAATLPPLETTAGMAAPATDPAAAMQSFIRWKRIGWLDLVLIFLMTVATIEFWKYIMDKI